MLNFEPSNSSVASLERDPIVIIGAGFGGLAMAKRLMDQGIEDFLVFERADDIGGTWRDNTYPGCACDVASNLYSLSFAQNPNWTRTYGSQKEIFAYLRDVTATLNLRKKIRFGHELLSARWVEERLAWCIETSAGHHYARVLITATGPFGSPVIPALEGQDQFGGRSFHSFNWDHEYDFTGKRVAVIGTGATAAQIVPELQKEAKQVNVFQRTPTWILPRLDSETSAFKRGIYRRIPLLQKMVRSAWYCAYEGIVGLPQYVHPIFLGGFEAIGRWHIRRNIDSPKLRSKLTPDFRFNCKRTLLSDAYYPALNMANVDLITDGIARFYEDGIETDKGDKIDVDVVVYATGFQVPNDQFNRIFSRDGQSLSSVFKEDMSGAYLGTSVSRFPNMFTMLGPFSAAGNQSAIFMLESQAEYIAMVMAELDRDDIASIDVKPSAQTKFVADVHKKSQRVSWVAGGCKSYYQDKNGQNLGLWPDWSFRYRRTLSSFQRQDFNCVYRRDVKVAPTDYPQTEPSACAK
ncbi:flavin-containing monooxygenase [Zhongshania aliphaticivorans]|uniref:flavin-containing monooxygenase n=1 Tax=Zhongshania aliphaticivorans TaxID=1470434 RepID=UPI0012E8B92E|nr:NAD(P)/FAD-dependent oxidoreductase [Zhongshania aliphaticivorans]